MSLEGLLAELEQRVMTPSWYQLLVYADEVMDALQGEYQNDPGGVADFYIQSLIGQVINRDRRPFARYIAAELVSFVDSWGSWNVSQGNLGGAIRSDLNNEAGILIYRRLVSSFISIQMRTSTYREERGGRLSAVQFRDLDELESWINEYSRRDSEGVRLYQDLFSDLFRVVTQANLAPDQPDDMLDRYYVPPDMVRAGVQPGDCVFREMGPWGPVGNPLNDFGHVGMYLGMDNLNADPHDPANHKIIQVDNSKPACQEATLHDFLHHKGKRLQFWGFYSVDLKPHERSGVISKARSYLGTGVYAFFKHYKSPPNFRCDGYVEHCYESVGATVQPLNYRGGLFEDDLWKTMNPSALRNCFTNKIVAPGIP